jgi:glycosyltransferase involved in cell wall biosynthesis/SAM-dependent methyltransferase
MFDLKEQGYALDGATNVWSRPGYGGIAYSDGDAAESKLGTIIEEAVDVSVLSPELRSHCTDWATLYHLSSSRGNILRPFQNYLGGSVLEVGAGCGAITRYLGECGANLLSLEGSPRRARIAASRTRDLSNVTVLTERFDDFRTNQKFDVITLIGVLEYASMFSGAPEPALGMLKRVRSLLNDGGHLFIAIENQLGLKYFAGALEDHVGLPMYGIEGRYQDGQPKTFGRKQLADLLKRAGFANSEFLSPSPDYKLPNSITTEQGFRTPAFDAAALAWQNVRKDPQLPGETLFSLEHTWPVIIANGLGMEMANSFLIAASVDDTLTVPADILAFHYSTGRKPVYCKESKFVQKTDGIELQYQPLTMTPCALAPASEDFTFILPKKDNYISGEVLSKAFLELSSTPGWSVDSFGQFLYDYLHSLKTLLGLPLESDDFLNAHYRLPGNFIDAVPQNIVIRADAPPVLIDVEWNAVAGVPIGHLVMRALLLLIAAAHPFAPGAVPLTRRDFVTGVMNFAGLTVTDLDLEIFLHQEAIFQAEVTGLPAAQFLDWAPDEIIYQTESTSPAPYICKVYYGDSEDNFDEENSCSIGIEPGSQITNFLGAEFKRPTRFLRIDPVDARTTFCIRSLCVFLADEPVWTWTGKLSDLRNVSHITELSCPDGSTLCLSTSKDPSFLLPIDFSTLQPQASLRIAMEIDLHKDEFLLPSHSVPLAPPTADESQQRDCVVLLHQIGDKLDHLLGETNKNFSTSARGTTAHPEVELQLKAQQLEHAIELSIKDNSLHQLQLQLANELASNSARIAALESVHLKALSDKDVHIYNLMNEHAHQLADKDTHIHHLNLQAIGLHASWSMRITRPVRLLGRVARKAKRAKSLLEGVIYRNGGLRYTLRKIVQILREGGLTELAARIRRVRVGYGNAIPGNPVDSISETDYSEWVRKYDTLHDADRDSIHSTISQWPNPPLISILMPVYNPPLSMLEEAVRSVQSQLYGHWQLCVADDASTDPEVKATLERLRHEDSRINVVYRAENGHISNATNSALDIATGEFVALMDNDDLLPIHALYWVARSIIDQPDVALIYSDEDKIDVHGRRSAPYFKTDWNQYLFRSHNMISHLGVYRRDLIEQVGRFRIGMEGSQDYDLALRCIEQVSDQQIFHIPKILYHWRIHAGSTAMSPGEKPYAQLAGKKALDEHLRRTGISGHTELLDFGMYRVHYDLPADTPLVSLIVPTRNAHALVKQCISSIVELTTYPNYEIILIDNGSDEPESLAYFQDLKNSANIRVIRDDGPFNYSALNNRAVQHAAGELIGLINNDIEVISPEWLSEMVSLALQPGAGAVGARLWYPDDRLQHGGIIMGPLTLAGHAHKHMPRGHHGYFGRASLIQRISAVTAACLIVRKSTFLSVGGLNEVELKIAFNDVDLCLKINEAGYQNIWTPNADLYHHESATRGVEDTDEKRARFLEEVLYMQKKWKTVIDHDPAYNPNLSLESEDFSIAFPPRNSKI